MAPHPVKRLLNAFWAVAFLLNSAGEATMAHGYAHHGGDHVATAVMEMAAHAEHSEDHHPGGHSAGHHSSAPVEDEAPFGHAEECTCAFFCGASSSLALSVDAPVGVVSDFDAEPSSTILPARTPPLRRPIPHFIAYPNGPPALI